MFVCIFLYVYLLTDSNILQCAAKYTDILCAANTRCRWLPTWVWVRW